LYVSNRNATLASGAYLSVSQASFMKINEVSCTIDVPAGSGVLNMDLYLYCDGVLIWRKLQQLFDFTTFGYSQFVLDFLKGITSEGETLTFEIKKNTVGVHDVQIKLDIQGLTKNR